MKPGLLKILCMYSGGLDSLGVLYKLLTAEEYADYKILVHHMILDNREDRAEAEKTAVEKTMTYFRENDYHPFEYTESTHEYRFQKTDFMWDMNICAFIAGSICATDVRIINVAMGRTETDIQVGGNSLFEEHMQMAQNVFKATLAVVRLKRKRAPKYIFPVMEMSKLDIWNMLPEELRRMSWSCRTPIYEDGNPTPCMHCNTCMDLQKYGIMG
ncbi:MAG: hypothetical protein H8D23_08180 [Candidatus Brocadiales bacterium]|nr:hypothetical protein [Candidatus Brocadiales bacterium]